MSASICAGISFTAPYVLIEGCYLVREDSPLRSNDEVDRPGRTVVVGNGSAYDLHLTRELKQATVLRSPTSPTWSTPSSNNAPTSQPASSSSSKAMPGVSAGCACCPTASW